MTQEKHLKFAKHQIASESDEAVGMLDVANNGMKDISMAGKDGLNIYYNEPIK